MATQISQIIQQDVKAAYSAFQNDDFRLVNIYANRIMTNSIFDKKPHLTLIGFFLKEVARIHDRMKAYKDLTTFATAKSIGDTYIKTVNVESGINKFWEEYDNFYNRIRKYEQDKYEKESYKDNTEFTHLTFRWLLDRLNKDRAVLFNHNNQFVRGILTEMDRIFRAHGGDRVDLYAFSLLRALELYSGYINYFSKDERNEFITKSMFTYIDDIVKTMSKDHVDPTDVTILLRRIILDWRVCYIRFMERPRLVPIEEKKVPITEETKKRISKSVEKALEEEVK